ncbi:OpgC domain-containing protein [Pseudomonas sp. 148P]|uniref:OpgC domain-containing protein n=1 Tax=Pseudomonas ulcerans TaxID=3115852 RepID=A0ABU7HLZ4_9PSED|nr:MULTISPECIES: OpgC domain-containing protein [unclassified Pseudomonas]MEE1921106.1 OpgC domain-containing protein [Pseudomonas sp. 147P]MEE1932545.1 OpgC domain-containing protein [Pseudomonas sp. 148P]
MTNARDHRIDFYRGLALVFIFWDHIPGNPLASATVRNFGFSDAAEIFVFLAGYAAVLAYGKVALRDGWVVACVRILRRAWVLYVVHIFLLVLLMGIVFVANNHVETRDMIQEMGLYYFLGNPQQALVDELLLRFKPNLMDPLPLYILLLLGLPLVLPLLLRRAEYAVGFSVALYLMAPMFQWNLAAQEGGVWFFNPLAWQLLFILGGAVAIHAQREQAAELRPLWRQPLFMVAAGYLLVCAAIALSWRWPEVHDALMPKVLAEWLYPISKTNLSPARLLHFLALAYCTARLLPSGPWVESWLAQQSCRMGRYSLEVFCLGVLLAPLADMANALGDDQWPMQVLTALAGVGLMMGLALWLDWNKRLNRVVTVQAA